MSSRFWHGKYIQKTGRTWWSENLHRKRPLISAEHSHTPTNNFWVVIIIVRSAQEQKRSALDEAVLLKPNSGAIFWKSKKNKISRKKPSSSNSFYKKYSCLKSLVRVSSARKFELYIFTQTHTICRCITDMGSPLCASLYVVPSSS